MNAKELLGIYPEFILGNPVDREELTAAERDLDFEFPAELKAILSISDGIFVRNPYLPKEARLEQCLFCCETIVFQTRTFRLDWNSGDNAPKIPLIENYLIIAGDGLGNSYAFERGINGDDHRLVFLDHESRDASAIDCETLVELLPHLDPFERD